MGGEGLNWWWMDGWISGVGGRDEEKEGEEDMWIMEPSWRER